MKKIKSGIFYCLLVSYLFIPNLAMSQQQKVLKALIIDGENNHGIWPKTTMMMKDFLEKSKLFKVDINRVANTWSGPHFDPSIGVKDITELLNMYPISKKYKASPVPEPVPDPNFSPKFSDYDLVISNFGWKASTWPENTKKAFEEYMKNGGGFVIVHAANNSYGDWDEYNKMIGLGGWGGRDQKSGPYVYFNNEGREVTDAGDGACGSHGPQHEFILTNRAPDHPIMKDIPTQWLHTKDELYDRLRGPAEGMTVLATAFSDPEKNGPPWAKDIKGSDRHEPMLMAIKYGKGRVFHTALGHMDYSMECVGFITTFLRGAEWVATGKVTQKIPKDFPIRESTSIRKWRK